MVLANELNLYSDHIILLIHHIYAQISKQRTRLTLPIRSTLPTTCRPQLGRVPSLPRQSQQQITRNRIVHPRKVQTRRGTFNIFLLRIHAAPSRYPRFGPNPLLPQTLPTIVTITSPRPKEQFVLIYFNNETPSSEYYFEFKNILALLPLRIAENLKEFILVKPYFYHKAYDYVGLGSISKQFNERYTTLDSCAELCTRLGITVQDFVSFVP